MLRIRSAKEREGGFTLIELMIVVAIIGILSAIAIPNFIRFQLRSRAGEGKLNIAGMRTAQEAYFAEFQIYLPIAVTPAAAMAVNNVKVDWAACPTPVTAADPGFCRVGWEPDGPTYYNYEVVVPATGDGFYAAGESDIDNDTVFNYWGFVKTNLQDVETQMADTLGCEANGGPLDLTQAATPRRADFLGPCGLDFGINVF